MADRQSPWAHDPGSNREHPRRLIELPDSVVQESNSVPACAIGPTLPVPPGGWVRASDVLIEVGEGGTVSHRAD